MVKYQTFFIWLKVCIVLAFSVHAFSSTCVFSAPIRADRRIDTLVAILLTVRSTDQRSNWVFVCCTATQCEHLVHLVNESCNSLPTAADSCQSYFLCIACVSRLVKDLHVRLQVDFAHILSNAIGHTSLVIFIIISLGRGAVMCVCVYSLCVRENISATTLSHTSKYFVHLTCGRGSFLLSRRCDMFCIISGFVDDDDVMFAHSGQKQATRKTGSDLSVWTPWAGSLLEATVSLDELTNFTIIMLYCDVY